MAKKLKTDYLFDVDLIDAIRHCWDRGIYYYPYVVPEQSRAMKFTPKVKIQKRQGKFITTGGILYNQGDELYEKIRELYLHKYKQLNKND